MSDHESWSEAILVPAENLKPTYWNCNEMSDEAFAALGEEIRDNGFDEPCQIVPREDSDDTYWIVNGEHRWKWACALGMSLVPCVIKHNLIGACDEDLMIWSVKRNNIKGSLSTDKYTKIERRLVERLGIKEEVARQKMLTQDHAEQVVKDKQALATDSECDDREQLRDRRKLVAAAKAFAEECLEDGEDTAEHGYLFVAKNGKKHLIINGSARLCNLVSEMVSVCKENSDSAETFLISAIKNELRNWE